MANTVKIKGTAVYLNNEKVGSVSFGRHHSKFDIEIEGHFIFTVDGEQYSYDTSCFGYSADANQYIRGELTREGFNALRKFAKTSRLIKKV